MPWVKCLGSSFILYSWGDKSQWFCKPDHLVNRVGFRDFGAHRFLQNVKPLHIVKCHEISPENGISIFNEFFALNNTICVNFVAFNLSLNPFLYI